MEIVIISLIILGAISIITIHSLRKLYMSVKKHSDETIRRRFITNRRELREIKDLLFVIAGDKIKSSQWGIWHYNEVPKGEWSDISPGDAYWLYSKSYGDTDKSKLYYQFNINMLKEEIQREKDEEAYIKSLQS